MYCTHIYSTNSYINTNTYYLYCSVSFTNMYSTVIRGWIYVVRVLEFLYDIICFKELLVGMADNQSLIMSDVRSQSAFPYSRHHRPVHGGPTAVLRDIDSSPSTIPLCPLGHRDGELQSFHDEGYVVGDKRLGLHCSQIEGVRCGYCEYIRLMRANVRRFKKMGIWDHPLHSAFLFE